MSSSGTDLPDKRASSDLRRFQSLVGDPEDDPVRHEWACDEYSRQNAAHPKPVPKTLCLARIVLVTSTRTNAERSGSKAINSVAPEKKRDQQIYGDKKRL
jgi:hypothetical protein